MSAGFIIENGVLIKYEGSDSVVVIPNGVTQIGENAFNESKTLTEVVMPDSVTSIGKYAFQKCIKLKSVVFSKQLVTIGYGAFVGCRALKEIELPETIKTIDGGTFAGCVKLAKVSCAADDYEVKGNPFSSYDQPECKLLFDKDGFLIVSNILYAYNGNADVITIPDGVTHIFDNTFSKTIWEDKSKVQKIILPDSVRYVGASAFNNCVNLKEIIMPEGIGFEANTFNGCTGLVDENGMIIIDNKFYEYYGNDTEITIPEGVEILADNLFNATQYGGNPSNDKITRIVLPESLKQIGCCCFRGCLSLQEINIPSNVKNIGVGAFYDCINLTKVEISETTSISNQAFYNCRSLKDDNGFIIINDFLFQYIGNASDVIVPKNVKYIGSNAFEQSRIKKIELPEGLCALGGAFRGCEDLEEVEIPEGITTIIEGTFNNCCSLKKAKLPSTLTTIQKFAFVDCKSLVDIKIPESVTEIGECAFNNCTAIKTLKFPSRLKNIPNQVCVGCERLESVTIAEGVEVIEVGAFFGCTSLEQIALPASLRQIKARAFQNCLKLENVEITDSECNIALDAFENCPKFFDCNDMRIILGTLVAYNGKGGVVEIPDGVHTIAQDAFREGYEFRGKKYRPIGGLREIVIPGSVKKICACAFKGCERLSKVVFNDGLEIIEREAFDDCESLSEIDLASTIRMLEKNAFAGCVKLTSIVIPKSLEVIESRVFNYCKNLTNIFVEEGNENYSDVDGVLFNKAKDKLIYCPNKKNLKTFTVPDNVTSIADYAFIDCDKINKLIIPGSVKEIGSYVINLNDIKDVEIAIGAGSAFVGENALIFTYVQSDDILVYPKIPVLFPKEQTIQVKLALGFCKNPKKYSGEYAEQYREYALSHQRTLLKKATQLKLQEVEDYFNSDSGENKLNLTLKKPNELQKVEILEEAVKKGTVEDLKAVLSTYKTFEMTARALALASRYRGVDFVRMLLESGANFTYQYSSSLQRKYTTNQQTVSGSYRTDYYLMIIPDKLDLDADMYGNAAYDYTPMFGIYYMNISDELEATRLPLKERLEVLKLLAGYKEIGISFDEMLFWSLTKGEIEIADALIEMDVNLNTIPPSYYDSWNSTTYLEVITTGTSSLYWNSYVTEMAKLKADKVLPVLERLNNIAKANGKRLMLSQKLFDEIKWNDESFAFAIKNIDVSKINQKKALESAVSANRISFLEQMADMGWLSQIKKRENLIKFAQDNRKNEALAWLIDFKNRTVDVAAEEAKAEAKMLKELNENPNSVSALKKLWSYKKLDDGTLQITNYKGDETEIVVPAQIGKATVSSIGEYAFGIHMFRKTANAEIRKKITSVVLSEGVKEISNSAFYECKSLTTVSLPSTLKTIGEYVFAGCSELSSIEIPTGTKNIGTTTFNRCIKLYKDNFLILNNVLYDCLSEEETIEIPKGVTKISGMPSQKPGCGEGMLKRFIIPDTVKAIGKYAFSTINIETLELPSSVEKIEKSAFYRCANLKEIHLNEGLKSIGNQAFANTAIRSAKIPETVTKLGAEVFYGCNRLRDISIPESVKSIGNDCFGWLFKDRFIHTTEGSYAEGFFKTKYLRVVIFYDYGKENF